jgi:hypothetical protein
MLIRIEDMPKQSGIIEPDTSDRDSIVDMGG